MKKFSFLFIVCALASTFMSCEKEGDITTVQDEIPGKWIVGSFTRNGVAMIPSDISRFSMEFEKLTSGDPDANFEWIIFHQDGSAESLTGEYELDDDMTELELTFNGINIPTTNFDMTINGDRMDLRGNIGVESWEIKAEKGL